MTTLIVGIASYEEMKERTMKIARGELKPAPDDPKIWVASADSLVKLLSAENRALLGLINAHQPQSLDHLAQLSGRQKSNLSRTLKSLATAGLVTLAHGPRGRITPQVLYDRITVTLPLSSPPPAAPIAAL